VHLRHQLVDAGVLPERDENVARTETWMRRFLEQASDHKAVIQPYANWVVLRRYRRRSQRRSTIAGARYTRSLVSIALEFLRWLGARDIDLAHADQGMLELWLAEGTSTHRRLRDFIRWTNRCGLTSKLDVPHTIDAEPANFLDEDEQVALLTRCVSDSEIPIDVRAAGALVLLYGIPVTRIVELTQDAVDHRGAASFLALGEHPVPMPPAIIRLVAAQAAAASSRRSTSPNTSAWLFPGRLAGRPTAATVLTQRLRAHDLDVKAARNTAVLTLAADLPAAVLSKILGIHINTAVDWTRHAAHDWNGYLAARSANPPIRSTPGPPTPS
jgi:hypothetical protein